MTSTAERERHRANAARGRATHPKGCADCGRPIPRGMGTPHTCLDCRTSTCGGCGIRFEPVRTKRRGQVREFHSQACYVDFIKRSPGDWRQRGRTRVHWPSCRVWFRECDVCGVLFTARRPDAKRCSKACRHDHNVTHARELQRRTRYTAIRYWAFDDSDAAVALAAAYYELRQELRKVRNGR